MHLFYQVTCSDIQPVTQPLCQASKENTEIEFYTQSMWWKAREENATNIKAERLMNVREIKMFEWGCIENYRLRM